MRWVTIRWGTEAVLSKVPTTTKARSRRIEDCTRLERLDLAGYTLRLHPAERRRDCAQGDDGFLFKPSLLKDARQSERRLDDLYRAAVEDCSRIQAGVDGAVHPSTLRQAQGVLRSHKTLTACPP